MFVEILAKPRTELVQYRIITSVVSFEDPGTRSPRIVILFTTTGEARSALTCARVLSIPNTPIWLVCPVTRSPVGYFRLKRFLRFVTTLAGEVDAGTLHKMRFLSAPCLSGLDSVEYFSDVRSVVLIPTRWWRPWEHWADRPCMLHANGMSVIL